METWFSMFPRVDIIEIKAPSFVCVTCEDPFPGMMVIFPSRLGILSRRAGETWKSRTEHLTVNSYRIWNLEFQDELSYDAGSIVLEVGTAFAARGPLSVSWSVAVRALQAMTTSRYGKLDNCHLSELQLIVRVVPGVHIFQLVKRPDRLSGCSLSRIGD